MRVSFLRPGRPAEEPRIITKEITVPPPNEIEPNEPPSRLKSIGVPILVVLLVVGMVGMMIRSGRTFSPSMLIMPLLMIGSVGFMASQGRAGSGGTSKGQLLQDRKTATRALGMVREQVFERGLSMHTGLQFAYPDPATLAGLIGTERMWSVTPISSTTADRYTALRYGLGEVELSARIVPPEAPPGEFLEPVSWVSTVRFLRHQSTTSQMPVVMTVKKWPVIGFTGDREVMLGMVRSMLCQAAVTHGPDNLAIVILTDNPDDRTWSWAKWLPHTQHPFELDQLGSARMMYSDWSTLQASLGGDEEDPDDPDKVIDFMLNFDPDPQFDNDKYRHVLVVVDSASTDKLIDSVIAPRAGVTWLLLDPPEHALTADEGVVMRCDPDRSVWRSEADRPLAEPVKVAIADQVSRTDAWILARGLARYEVATLANVSRQVKQAERGRDWQTLMRVRDPGALDVLESWSVISRYDDKRRLRFPIGFLSNGDRLELDIKQAAEGGTGPHGQLLGTTGSGKSEFLRNLVLNGCCSHSPDMLNFLLVDFKGGAAFVGLETEPHVTAVITNMEEESHLVARLHDMLYGEIDRRYRIFRDAKAAHPRYDVKDLADYTKLRERGADLPPLPTLMVVIDEWAELLMAHPEFGELFKRLGRVGRSVAIHLLYASQSLDVSGKTSGLETNIGYKIGLKTQTMSESRQLLDNSDAAYRLPGDPGHGVLRPTGGDLHQFYAGWTGAAYFPPVPIETNGHTPANEHTAHRPHESSQVVPRKFTARALPLPKSAAQEIIAEPERTEEEIESAPTLFTTIIDRLKSVEFRDPYRMWLPPLNAITLDQVDPDLRQWQAASNDTLVQLRVPIGLFDDPEKHTQPPWILDARNNIMVVGAPQTGKSTAVKTIACALALYNTPEQLQMYIIDGSGGGLERLSELPHVGAVVPRADSDGVNRILTQMSTLLADRARLFREHRLDIDAYRELRTDPSSPFLQQDPYGDVVVIIDGWDALAGQDQVMQYRGGEMEQLMQGSSNYGLHFITTFTRTAELRGIEPNSPTVIELHNENEMPRVSSALAKLRRREPGHAIMTDVNLQGLLALPRIDSHPERADIPAGMTALIDLVKQRFDQGAERLRTLPTSLLRDELGSMVAAADQEGDQRLADKRRLRIALGLREDTLGPAYAEMFREPHLVILGEAKSGKSELIGTFCDSIARRFDTKDDAVIVLIDPRRRHLGRVNEKNLFAHVHREDDIVPVMDRLFNDLDLAARDLPADIDQITREMRSWWSGPEVFIVVDDYHLAADPKANTEPILYKMLPWVAEEPLARGFHLTLARTSTEMWVSETRDPVFKRLMQDRAPVVMLSGDKTDAQIAGTKFERFGIPGRGRYLETSLNRKNRIQAAWSGIRESSETEFKD
jgi:DNA segregation ATPase FtsK/SpoIIIE, S-DNA-T family